ncbi:pathogen-associated molecular patterns-induced protein A70 [Humulus lupulus]|uniref:pathogen-associated molecular patterns-induced protein A70 n=1 Tax=Humulus lupulus TaxID=3486 RepID=UPI002B400E4E|nr:pathogen-associated molecular patterns-induced protein A70 [Humulus lupulus]
MLAFTASWLTPSSLFLFLNLMIGTLFLMSRFGTRNTPTDHAHGSHQLVRSGSLLERVKSFNLSLYKFESPAVETEYLYPTETDYSTQTPQLARTPSFIERLRSIDLSYVYRFDHQQAHPEPEPEILRPEANTPAHHPTEPERSTQFQNPTNPPQLARTPSFLERLRSIDLSYVYRFDHQQSYPEPEPKIRQPEAKTPDPNPAEDDSHDHPPVKRSKSESHHSARTEKKSQSEMMTKSSSEKMGHSSGSKEDVSDDDEEENVAAVERRRPVTTRVEKRSSIADETTSLKDFDDGVDAKADDFINRFKQQLKLQRLESFKRFSEMISRK